MVVKEPEAPLIPRYGSPTLFSANVAPPPGSWHVRSTVHLHFPYILTLHRTVGFRTCLPESFYPHVRRKRVGLGGTPSTRIQVLPGRAGLGSQRAAIVPPLNWIAEDPLPICCKPPAPPIRDAIRASYYAEKASPEDWYRHPTEIDP